MFFSALRPATSGTCILEDGRNPSTETCGASGPCALFGSEARTAMVQGTRGVADIPLANRLYPPFAPRLSDYPAYSPPPSLPLHDAFFPLT